VLGRGTTVQFWLRLLDRALPAGPTDDAGTARQGVDVTTP
jgi:hypothetical protein